MVGQSLENNVAIFESSEMSVGSPDDQVGIEGRKRLGLVDRLYKRRDSLSLQTQFCGSSKDFRGLGGCAARQRMEIG